MEYFKYSIAQLSIPTWTKDDYPTPLCFRNSTGLCSVSVELRPPLLYKAMHKLIDLPTGHLARAFGQTRHWDNFFIPSVRTDTKSYTRTSVLFISGILFLLPFITLLFCLLSCLYILSHTWCWAIPSWNLKIMHNVNFFVSLG